MNEPRPSSVATGIEGLDEILGGGLRPGAIYLVEGEAGTGKTTVGLQFVRSGVDAGESALYFSLSETVPELREIARSHGWRQDDLDVRYLKMGESEGGAPQTMIEPGELFLPRVTESILSALEEVQPKRVVIDSLADLRLVSQDIWLFRSQVTHLRDALIADGRITMLLDTITTPYGQHLRTIASGILSLEQTASEFGPAKRRLTVLKMRARSHGTGAHDFRIVRGGVRVFSPLKASGSRAELNTEPLSSGLDSVDALLGGGLDRGSSVLVLGPAGVGKSMLVTQYVAAATKRGERTRVYLFDEREQTFLKRARGVGLELERFLEGDLFDIRRVDPGEMSPGEFASAVRDDVENSRAEVIVLDSLSGYLHAMPNIHHLQVHLHELLTYLARKGVVALMILGEQGPFGSLGSALDLSYLADTVILFRYFEYGGEMRRALSVYKKRSGNHERLIREVKIDDGGIHVGDPLHQFSGILTGLPHYVGKGLS